MKATERTPLTERYALNYRHAADFLSVSDGFLKILVRRGELRTFHMEGCVRFLRADLEAYADRQHQAELGELREAI